jgi:hypothetical protein
VGRSVNWRPLHPPFAPRILEDYQPARSWPSTRLPGATSVEYLINISLSLLKFTCTHRRHSASQAQSFPGRLRGPGPQVRLGRGHGQQDLPTTGRSWRPTGVEAEGPLRGCLQRQRPVRPSITSLFDFPTNDPSYTEIGTPTFGYRGDIRYQGCTLDCGVLPNDRTHQFKLYSNYSWSAVNVGVGLNVGTGIPLTDLAANPNYQNSGEIPVTARGGGITTVEDGALTRAPMDFSLDAHVDYTVKFGGQRILLIADAFNLFNRQTATNYDFASDSVFGASNPNYGYASSTGGGRATSYQAPFALRLGARFEW